MLPVSFPLPKDNLEYGLVAAFVLMMLVTFLWKSIVELATSPRMTREQRRWRMRVLQTNFGRDSGWFVELDGRQIGLLTDQCFAEMFWDDCALTPLVEEPAERERLMSDAKWWHTAGLKFRNREFDVYAEYAFAAGSVFTDPGRVMMRGLYINVEPPMTDWEEYWIRRARSRRQQVETHSAHRKDG